MPLGYVGDFTPGKTVRGDFNTRDTDQAPITLAGTPSLAVYKDDGTTQDTDGLTLNVDFDSVTGSHVWEVDTSADGTFYSAGADFFVKLAAGTVDSISVVGVTVGHFSLANRSALRPTTADRTLDVSAGGEAGVDWANVGGKTTTNDLSGTTVKTATDIATLLDTEIAAILAAVDTEIASILADTNELQTDWVNGGRLDLLIDSILGDTNELQTDWVNGGRLDLLLDATLADTNELQGDWADGGRLDLILDARASQTSVDTVDDYLDTEMAAVLAAVDTEIAAIVGYVDDIGVAGAGLTAIPWNASWDAEVQSEVDDALKATLIEGYRSQQAVGSVRDMLYEITAHLGRSAISGTGKTINKLDNTTPALTFTLDDATTPTAIEEDA